LNSLSPVKVSETFSFIKDGYSLGKKDFDYFGDAVHSVIEATDDWPKFN
jgi:hypothetical protein